MVSDATDRAPSADPLGGSATNLKDIWSPKGARRTRWLRNVTEPHILYPAIAVLILVAIWGGTWNLIRVERMAAETAAAAATRELALTYEAQVVRALREIDQTLKLVKYAYHSSKGRLVLETLRENGLLPPDLVFVVTVANEHGEIVAGTRPPEKSTVEGEDYFEAQRNGDVLSIGLPQRASDSPASQLQFSRRMDGPGASFAGAVMVAADADYFVSGYEASKMGEHGVLGILGTDGVFRARRSGSIVSAGDKVDYAKVVPKTNEGEDQVRLSTSSWDSVPRYTSAYELYDFPLALIVGLSREEQLATARRSGRVYVWRALGSSLFLVLIVAGLGRMSRQLALGRVHAVEEQIAHAARVEYLAYHDGLTKLPNRGLFSKLLGQSIHMAHRYQRQLAVLFLDLDRFKQINDTLGHEAGDQLLQEVATRLKTCLRDSDTVARLGGDEFVVLLPELEEEKYVSTVAQKILSTLAEPFMLAGQEFRVTASIGISTYPQDGSDELTLTKNADIAMYKAKESGKNNFQFYSEKLNANSLERLTLESGLRHGVAGAYSRRGV